MSSVPTHARVVIIGAGIVGNSMAWHLARLGWRDIVLLEKGTLPSPGGSTGHASNFIFLTDHSKEMTAFTVDSTRQYQELGVFDETGILGGVYAQGVVIVDALQSGTLMGEKAQELGALTIAASVEVNGLEVV